MAEIPELEEYRFLHHRLRLPTDFPASKENARGPERHQYRKSQRGNGAGAPENPVGGIVLGEAVRPRTQRCRLFMFTTGQGKKKQNKPGNARCTAHVCLGEANQSIGKAFPGLNFQACFLRGSLAQGLSRGRRFMSSR